MGLSYGELFTANMRAAKARARLSNSIVSRRMKALGFDSWSTGKVSECERGKRIVTTAELYALAVTLECTIAELTGATLSTGEVEFPTGDAVGAVSVRNSALGMNDHAVVWEGPSRDGLSITRPATPHSARAWDRTLMSA